MRTNELDTRYLLTINGSKLDKIAEMASEHGVSIAAFVRGAFDYIIENPDVAIQIEPVVPTTAKGRRYVQRHTDEQVTV